MATGYAIDTVTQNSSYAQAISDDGVSYFDLSDNNSTITVTNDTILRIGLEENSYLHFRWYLKHTSGLSIIDESYNSISDPIMDPSNPILYRCPIDYRQYKYITHIWTIKATGQGTQSINADLTYRFENVWFDVYHFGMTVIIRN
jgi:predicted secreted protein